MEREIKRLKSIKRRNFFSTLGKGIAGIFVLNVFPIKLFGKSKREKSESIKVNIHPLAVKRTKRG